MGMNKSTATLSPPDQCITHSSSTPTIHPLKRIIFLLSALVSLLLLHQIHFLNLSPWTISLLTPQQQQTLPFLPLKNKTLSPWPISLPPPPQQQQILTFLPLKNQTLSATPTAGNTWFMSTLSASGTLTGEAEHLHFPSPATGGKILCLVGNHTTDGTKNSYALASPENLSGGNTTTLLLKGLTLVSETYYDYENLWHGLSAVTPFAGFRLQKNRGWECPSPERWVLYHWGELRTHVGGWMRSLMEVTFGKEVVIEELGSGFPVRCFEEAVVFRRNEGGMSGRRRGEVYDMLRCKARRFCGVGNGGGGGGNGDGVRMTLLLRTGARSFRNETVVIGVFRRACEKVDGCRFTVARPDNLTFCGQVKLLSSTDVLVSPHGAQMTNLIFMDRGSSIMEFYPKGWLDLAGPGQYVFRWLAGYAGMAHEGSWWDPHDGPDGPCPFQPTEKDGFGAPRCFTEFYKDCQLGHDEAYFAKWADEVLGRRRPMGASAGGTSGSGGPWQNESDSSSSTCGPCR